MAVKWSPQPSTQPPTPHQPPKQIEQLERIQKNSKKQPFSEFFKASCSSALLIRMKKTKNKLGMSSLKFFSSVFMNQDRQGGRSTRAGDRRLPTAKVPLFRRRRCKFSFFSQISQNALTFGSAMPLKALPPRNRRRESTAKIAML